MHLTKLPVSVFIITLNEADRVHRPILSVRDWVDEVIVVDSGSSDGTRDKAESLGARVHYHAWAGYGLQKRFGEDQCRNDWLLNIDADEELTPELVQEIQALFAQGLPEKKGYLIHVRDLLPSERKLSPFSHTNRCLRLYNKRVGRFSDSPVHDSVIMDRSQVGQLTHPALHRSFRSLAHAIDKMNGYSTAQANDMARRGKRVKLWRLGLEFPLMFLKSYLLRLYIMRGLPGFSYSLLYAMGRYIRLAKARELDNDI